MYILIAMGKEEDMQRQEKNKGLKNICVTGQIWLQVNIDLTLIDSYLLTMAFLMQAFFSVFISVEFWQGVFTSLSLYF